MVKTLNTLIKLSQRELDAKRRDLVKLQEQREQALGAIEKLKEQLEAERQVAFKELNMASVLESYAKKNKQRQQKLMEAVKDFDKKILAKQDEIAIQFGDLKKYEILRDNTLERERKELARRETLALDEMATNRFTRKEENGEA